MKNILRRVARASWVAVGLLAASCAKDENPSGPAEPEHPRTVAEVLDAYTGALEARDLDAYVALLDEDFEFCPRLATLDDFPWLAGRPCWNRAEEIDMIANMFDPEYESPSSGYAAHRLEAGLDVHALDALPDGAARAFVSAVLQVFWSDDTGVRSETMLAFVIAPGVDGLLRIRSIEELDLELGRADDLPPIPVPPRRTWASIKADFKSGGG